MKNILILLISLLFVGCSTKNLSPTNVSDYFWTAQKEQNYEDVKKFVRESDQDDLKLQKGIKIRSFDLKKAIVDNRVAKVPTILYIDGILDKKGSVDEVRFDTVLIKESDGWKVNLKATRRALYLEVMKKFSGDLGRGIFSKIEESLENLSGFQEALKSILDSFKGAK